MATPSFIPDLLFWQCRCYLGCRSINGRLLQPNPCISWQMLLFLARIVPYTVALPSRPIACLLLHLTAPAWCRLHVLSSKMQSALTSNPTNQDISGVKQYQYLDMRSCPKFKLTLVLMRSFKPRTCKAWMNVGGLTYGSFKTLYRVQRLLSMIRKAESFLCIWNDS